jgi:mannitol/fructose-specific phosphotransferase system IIA component (Ntr-type)
MKEPCNSTCDAWGSVGHGQKIALVHCERKPKCASKGTIISMKSEKIVNFQSMKDPRLFIEMSVCFITIIVDNIHGFQNMIL